jgi:ligand-binding sensor domain-containing protein
VAVGIAVTLGAVGACGPVPAGGGGGGLGAPRPRGSLRREDRVVLTRANDVTGVAASQRLVYVATTGGLAVYDRTFHAWRPPLAAGDLGDALPTGRPTALAADPATDAVWVGGVGYVTYYQPTTDFTTRATVPGAVDVIAFDRRDPSAGAYVRATGQWSLVSSSGFVRPLSPGQLPAGTLQAPPTLRQLYEEFPALQSFGGLLTRDAELRSWPVSAAAKSPDRTSELWVGTAGGGLFRVDPSFNQAEQLPYGLLDSGAGALALAADGVWIAGLGESVSARGGLTFASDDLQRWRWVESPYSGAQSLAGARAFDLEVRGSRAWLATDRGLARVDTRAGGGRATDVVVWSALNGLPSDVALAVAARPDGAWVGTSSGLVFVSDSGSARSAGPSSVSPVLGSGGAVRALLATGDTLWVGTDFGLDFVPPAAPDGSRRLVRAAAQSTDARLAGQVTALATSDTVVAVATRDAILRFDRRNGRLLPSADVAALAALGGVRALAMDDNTIWAAGPGGVLILTRAAGNARVLSVPADLPAEALDVVLSRDYAWVATRGGVVRLRRFSDGTVP